MDLKSLVDKLKAQGADLTTLKIETKVVGTTGRARALRTTIDLIDGDIVNEVHADFLTGDLEQLRAFHGEQVSKAEGIVAARIEMLKAILGKLGELLADEPETDES
ncbi:MAG: hypothetical protein KC613_07435 [Myxococcales bacterium]|nr:hypothetical protein [Myxococcales bacterium]MCB9526530.1 hypothetical protein [Myxococcales bacterium]